MEDVPLRCEVGHLFLEFSGSKATVNRVWGSVFLGLSKQTFSQCPCKFHIGVYNKYSNNYSNYSEL